jgi:hypothetical protein
MLNVLFHLVLNIRDPYPEVTHVVLHVSYVLLHVLNVLLHFLKVMSEAMK